ncbi:carboxypeptidase regulatory-like domain-containing protein [Planctomycetota bacterium]
MRRNVRRFGIVALIAAPPLLLMALTLWPRARSIPTADLPSPTTPATGQPHEQIPALPRTFSGVQRDVPQAPSQPKGASEAEGDPAALSVRTLDGASEKPLANIAVRVRGPGKRERRTTDDHGWARFPGIPAGRYVVDASGGDYQPTQQEITLWSSPLEVELVLSEGHTIHGVVRNTSGAPLRGVTVKAEAMGLAHAPLACSGNDGRYSLGGLPPGEVEIVARAPKLNPPQQRVSHTLPEGPPAQVTIDFVFRKGCPVDGRVVDDVGTPVAGVHLEAQVKGVFEPYETVSSEGGAFRFESLPGTEARVFATARGYVQQTPLAVRLTPGVTVSVEVRLGRGGVLAGTVLDPRGRGFAKVRVQAELVGGPPPSDKPSTAAVTETDGNGRFAFPSLTPGVYRCRVVCPGYPEALSAEIRVEVGREASTGDLQLREGAVIAGKVLAAGGTPVARARVEYRAPAANSYADHVVTDRYGIFMIRGLADGKMVLRARAEGFLEGTERTVQVRPGGVPDLELVLAEQPILRGFVRSATGEPLANAWVAAVEHTAAAARTDEEGSFSLPAPTAGEHTVLIHAQGFQPVRARAAPGRTVEIVLEPITPASVTGPAILGTLRLEGKAAAGYLVMARPVPGGSQAQGSSAVETVSDENGRFAIPVSQAASWEIAVLKRHGHNDHVETRTVDVGAHGTTLSWDLERCSH